VDKPTPAFLYLLQKLDVFENCLKVVFVLYFVCQYLEHHIVGHRVFVLYLVQYAFIGLDRTLFSFDVLLQDPL